MMQHQQQAPPIAPGNPIGYAPIYGASPLSPEPSATPLPTQDAPGKRWIDGLLMGGLVAGAVAALTTWAVLDSLYAGSDIRGLQRAANAANVTAQSVEQRAANAEANAQQWQAHSQMQDQTLEGVRALVCP